MRMGRRTNLLLPDDLVREIDRVAGPRNRSRFVAEAVRDRLRRERLREAWATSFGAIRREEHPEWATPDRVEAWVRELRAEETVGGPGARAVPGDPGDGDASGAVALERPAAGGGAGAAEPGGSRATPR
jgi:predicted transcriptional regulator